MKILITGATGQLGRSLLSTRPKRINNLELNFITPKRSELNLLNPNSCMDVILKYSPDWVINAAAFTNVDLAEDEKERAIKINSESPSYIAQAVDQTKGNFIHISTDYVFDGKSNKPYKVNAKKNPINFYGKTKSDGEDNIKNVLLEKKNFFIIRTSWLMSPFGKNFLKTILKIHPLKEEINVISDQIGCPTNAKNLAKLCWEIIKYKSKNINLPSIMHYSEQGFASWYDIACEIESLGYSYGILEKKNKIKPISANQFLTKSVRPNYSILDTTETRNIFKLEYGHWKKSIKSIIKEIKFN